MDISSDQCIPKPGTPGMVSQPPPPPPIKGMFPGPLPPGSSPPPGTQVSLEVRDMLMSVTRVLLPRHNWPADNACSEAEINITSCMVELLNQRLQALRIDA